MLAALDVALAEFKYEGSGMYEWYGAAWEALIEGFERSMACPQCSGEYALERFLWVEHADPTQLPMPAV